jgi:hypothetical protein
VRISDWRLTPRLTAAMLVVALGWPSTAIAMAPPEPIEVAEPTTKAELAAEPEPTTKAEPDAEAEGDEPPPSSPTVEPTPERKMDTRAEQADRHWLEGERLYRNGRYAEAAEEFERSFAAVPAAATLYSVALSYQRASKPVDAVRALQRYLALPECPPDAPPEERTYCTEQRALAERALAEQRRLVGELVITLGDGVKLREVKVAGRTVPLDDFPLVLPPGTVDVEVFGLEPDERRSRAAYITAGEVFTLYVAPFDAEVIPGPVPTPTKDDTRRLERRQRQMKTTFWVGTGLTAVSGVALAVTGGLTLYHQRRFELCPNPCVVLDAAGNPVLDENGDTIPQGTEDRDVYPDDHEAAFERYRPITNALVGVTVGLAVVTALVGTFAFRKRDGAAASGRSSKGQRVRARVRLGGSGLVVQW